MPLGRFPQVLGLNTLAMGDSIHPHLKVLQQHASALQPIQPLFCRQAVPKGDAMEMLAIGDHVCLQRVPLAELAKKPVRHNTVIFEKCASLGMV